MFDLRFLILWIWHYFKVIILIPNMIIMFFYVISRYIVYGSIKKAKHEKYNEKSNYERNELLKQDLEEINNEMINDMDTLREKTKHAKYVFSIFIWALLIYLIYR